MRGDDHAGVERAAEWLIVSGHSAHGRQHHMIDNIREGFDIEVGRRECAHATGVRPKVAIAQALVVTRGRQREQRGAIAQRQYRYFFAYQALLEQHPPAGVASHKLRDCRDCFLNALGDDHTLAARQTIGFNHPGQIAGAREIHRLNLIIEGV